MKTTLFCLFLLINVWVSAQQIYPTPTSIVSLKNNDSVPVFSTMNINNQAIDSKTLFTQKPTVLIFYRAGWCPFCNTHLADIQSIEEQIKKLGYQIIAISTDLSEKLKETTKSLNLNYTLLSDPNCEVASKFGIAFWAGEKWTLPVPSLYVINKEGIIKYNYSNADYKTRISSAEVLNVLKKMK